MDYLGGCRKPCGETMPIKARAMFNQKSMKTKYKKKKNADSNIFEIKVRSLDTCRYTQASNALHIIGESILLLTFLTTKNVILSALCPER